jgi:hypothetical protein
MKKILSLLLVISLFYGCNQDDENEDSGPTLPLITQTGENTFGCKINGIVVIPRDGTGTFTGPDRGMYYWGSTSTVYTDINVVDFKSGTSGRINIHLHDLYNLKEGDYFIGESNGNRGFHSNPWPNFYCRVLDSETQTIKRYFSVEEGGIITITRFDLDNRIVSGIFNGRAANINNPTDIIEITEGRFDINWEELPGIQFP